MLLLAGWTATCALLMALGVVALRGRVAAGERGEFVLRAVSVGAACALALGVLAAIGGDLYLTHFVPRCGEDYAPGCYDPTDARETGAAGVVFGALFVALGGGVVGGVLSAWRQRRSVLSSLGVLLIALAAAAGCLLAFVLVLLSSS